MHIIDFYIRRVRRIFPALITVLIATLVLGWFVLLPDEYRLLGKHVFGGSVYVNNIMLYMESGNYFNVESNAKPLLHLWSLGVEEQFYLIFPLFLWLIYRFNLNFVFSLTVFTVVSFILCKNGIKHNNQPAAFYLPWCRFWELSIGAILAYIVLYHKEFIERFKVFCTEVVIKKVILRKPNVEFKDGLLNNICSIVGLILIVVGIFTIKNNLKFPGTKALIPVFGALLIIAAGNKAYINRKLLSNPVTVFLGLISYPLYLWHWPLLSFAYICEAQVPEAWIRLCAIVISFILAALTYLLIEPPLRYGKHRNIKAIGLFITLFVIGFLGYRVYDTGGFPHRFKGDDATFKIFEHMSNDADFHASFYGGREIVDGKYEVVADNSLHYGHIKGKPEYLVTGDSFAWQYGPYFEKNLPYAGIFGNGLICYKDYCYDYLNGAQIKQYPNLINALNTTDISKIIIAHAFGGDDEAWRKIESSFVFLADTYKNKNFYLVGPVNPNPVDVVSCIYMKTSVFGVHLISSLRNNKNCSIDYRMPFKSGRSISHEKLKYISSLRNNLHYIDIRNAFCDDNGCRVWLDNGLPIYSDKPGHLSVWGKDVAAEYILKEINSIK